MSNAFKATANGLNMVLTAMASMNAGMNGAPNSPSLTSGAPTPVAQPKTFENV